MKWNKNNSSLGSFPILKWADNFTEVWFWCDYLRLCFHEDIEKFRYYIELLDFDNSNTWFFNFWWVDYTYYKEKTPIWISLKFLVSYSWVSIPVYEWLCFDKNTRDFTWYYWKFDVYGAYFRLVELQYFKKLDFAKFIKNFSKDDPNITRYDFRIDYFNKFNYISIPEPKNIIKIHSQSKVDIHYMNFTPTNWGVWSKNTWRYYLRYYDKKLDTNSKWKWILYSDYLCYESVHRLEYQLESAYCRWFKLSNLIKLEDKIYTSLKIDKLFNWCNFYSYDVSKEINSYNKWRHIQRFRNQVNKFVNAWYNSFQLLYDSLVDLYGTDWAELQFQEFLDKYFSKNEKS